MKFCTDVFGITLTITNFSCHVLLCWGLFCHIFGPTLVCDLLFLENCSIFFHEIFYRFLKTLWPFFNCLKATEPLRGDSLPFTTKSPEGPGLSITLIGLVLLWQSLHKRKVFSFNHPFG